MLIFKIYFCHREREALAYELAREIEGSQSSRNAVELDNGDEEEAFSAVVRPQKGLFSEKLPNKQRSNVLTFNLKMIFIV